MLKKFALLGKNIGHSRSPQVYEALLGEKVCYELLDFPDPSLIPDLKSLVLEHKRVSVTAPYKEYVFERCETASALAKKLRAVNAIKISKGQIEGTNTDALAFESLYKEQFEKRVPTALVLGDGAMSRLAVSVFEAHSLPYKVLSRKIGNLNSLEEEADKSKRDLLIVNTCSREYSLNFKSHNSLILWDMNYSMPKHKEFADRNAHEYHDGEELLIRQARYALSFWNS